MKKQIKVVFLDWNGTLSDSVFWGHLDGTYKQDFFNKVRDSLFNKHVEEIKPWMKGEITTEDILKKIANDTNLNFEEILEEFKKGCETMDLADKKVVKLIGELRRKGIKCVISTDNMDSFTRWTAPRLGLYEIFDEILSSAELKILKREKNKEGKSLFLEKFLMGNGISYSECVMIDDGEDKGNVMLDSGVDYRKIESSSQVRDILASLL